MEEADAKAGGRAVCSPATEEGDLNPSQNLADFATIVSDEDVSCLITGMDFLSVTNPRPVTAFKRFSVDVELSFAVVCKSLIASTG